MAKFSELATMDATAQAALVREGEATPLELVKAAIERIESTNPRLNAVITPLFEKACMQASGDLPDGPFKGVPYLLKDLDSYTEGDPYHCGMKFLRDLKWIPDHETFYVTKIRKAGFVVLGKTNTPELGLTVTTEPEAYGPTRNPWNTGRSSGGSSGGSACAVAAGMVPAAHASDGGGSIRVPSSACGIVGLKPSRGRVSPGPKYGEWWHGYVTLGAITRSVRDIAAIMDVISGVMPGDLYTAPTSTRPFVQEVGVDPGRLRIGLLRSFHVGDQGLHPDCRDAIEKTGRMLESAGHIVEDAYPSALDEYQASNEHFMTTITPWVTATLDEWSQITGQTIGEHNVEALTWNLSERGRGVTAAQYITAMIWIHRFVRRMADWWENGFDLLILPTITAPPPELGALTITADCSAEEIEEKVGRVLALMPFSYPFNLTGQPSVSLPLHWNKEGLPIGVQIVAAYGREDLLIRISSQLETAMPWADHRPPVHA
jgi:amidase